MRSLGVVVLLGAGCRPSEVAPTELGDPMVEAYGQFEADDAVLAPILAELEAQLYQAVQVDSGDVVDRSLLPPSLSSAQIAGLEGAPDRDPAAAVGMMLSFASAHDIDEHATLPLIADQRPLEPASPDHYDRTFLEGEDCWADRSCLVLRTHQDLTKVYTGGLIPPIQYEFFKDFRWINLGTPGDERWVYTARTWNPGSFSSEKGDNTIFASYTLEVWYPRDGRGFVWGAGEQPDDDQGDSTGTDNSPLFRFQTVWSEQHIELSDDPTMVAGTIRWGLDRNFEAHEDWLNEHPAE